MPPDLNSSRSARSHGIFHPGKDKDVGDQAIVGLPAHVNTVKDGLLDFNRFLGLEATILVLGDEDTAIPLSAYKTDALKDSQRAKEREFLENAQRLAEGAQRFESEFAQDSEWRTLFRIVITSQADDVYYSGSHLPSPIACAGNEVWDTDLDPSRSSHTNPKPDLYFGFPVHNIEGQKNVGFRNDPSLQNYTVDTLSQLTMKGLRSIPASGSLIDLAKMKRDITELQFPLLCFPWCIIQLKGVEKAATIEENEESSLETNCQASIAASGALAMLEKLARFADVKQDGQHIPPVITITSVGPNTTVWLAYSDIIDDQYRDHKMLSIWNGRISKIWDAIQFCRIIDNLFFWSQNILRPKVSHYIDQWRLRYCPEVHKLHFQLEKDLETAELIHRIQDRLSSLNISPNSNLPELIQQAVILQEVMKPNLRKTEPAPKESPDQNVQDEIESSKKVPFHPKVDSLAEGASGNAVTEKSKQGNAESKEEEDDKEEDLDRDNGPNDTYYSAGSQDKPNLQAKSPEKHESVFADLPVSCEKSANGDSTATENEQAAARKQSPTSEHVSKFEPSTDSSPDEKRDSELFFSYPYEFKTSDFELKKGRVLSYSKESKRVRINFEGRQPRVMALGPPNPFIATRFELSFDVKTWWDILLVEVPSPRMMRVVRGPGLYSTQFISSTGMDEEDSSERITRSDSPKRRILECQPAEILRPPLLQVKIPWKGKHFIAVKLPPALPAPFAVPRR